jgi:hypothetical protein
MDLLLRASNEGLLRPRVARAWKIIRLHPPLHRARSASKEGTWPLPAPFFSILLYLTEVGCAQGLIRNHLVKCDLHAPLPLPIFQ